MRRAPTAVISVLIFAGLASTAQARVVTSTMDLDRLRGYGDHQEMESDLEEDRLSDIEQVRKQREEWEKKRNSDLAIYLEARKHFKAALDESSPEYRADQAERKKDQVEHEESRREYIQDRDNHRREERATIALTEEHEYGLDLRPPLVDWNKRQLLGPKGPGGARGAPSSGRFSGSPGGAAGEMPPPEFLGAAPPPPPDFYDSGAPGEPVIVPPPMYEEGAIPPPPPPPVFDEPGSY